MKYVFLAAAILFVSCGDDHARNEAEIAKANAKRSINESAALEEEVKALRERLTTVESQLSETRNALTESEEELKTLSKSYQSYQATADVRLMNLESDTNSLGSEWTTLYNSVAVLQQMSSAAVSDITKLEVASTDKAVQIATLAVTTASLNSGVSNLSSGLNSTNDNVASLDGKVNLLDQQVDDFYAATVSMAASLANLSVWNYAGYSTGANGGVRLYAIGADNQVVGPVISGYIDSGRVFVYSRAISAGLQIHTQYGQFELTLGNIYYKANNCTGEPYANSQNQILSIGSLAAPVLLGRSMADGSPTFYYSTTTPTKSYNVSFSSFIDSAGNCVVTPAQQDVMSLADGPTYEDVRTSLPAFPYRFEYRPYDPSLDP